MSKVLVERNNHITVLTINRPEVHNCIDGETAASISDAVRSFAADDGARVLVVTGAGDAAFCTGADLKSSGSLTANPASAEVGPLGFARLDPGKPTISAVNGYCFAGGMELAAWCDFRVASGNAEFGILNRRWGVPLIDGGTVRLPAIVGTGNALYLIESGVRIGAERALQMGFVQEVTPKGAVLTRALELAGHIAAYPAASLRADRASALDSFGSVRHEALKAEAEKGFETLSDPEMAARLRGYAEGVRPEAPRG